MFAINELLYEALATPNGRFWYVAPTYSQAKMIAWRMLSDKLMELPPELVIKKNESELYVIVGNNSMIELKGSDNEDNLRGTGLHGVVMDEYAMMKGHLFDEIVRPMLTDYEGWGIFVSTPKGFNHFHELYELGLKDEEDNEYKSFHYSSYDNPHLKKLEIEKAKEKMGPELFGQEYMAEFTRFTGAIYKEFDPKYHILPADWKPDSGEEVYRAMDFGSRNPTVCLWIHENREGEITVFDEYYQSEQTTEHHAGVILSKHTDYSYRQTFGDPSGAQFIQDFAHHGLFISPATKQTGNSMDWIVHGITEIRALMRIYALTQRPKLFITENCVKLIEEIKGYRWVDPPKRQDSEWRDMPVKVDDHGPDALRYFVVSHRPSENSRRRAKRRIIPRQRSSVTGY